MYRTESVLGLIGAIFACVATFFILIFGVIIGAAAAAYGAGGGFLAMVIIGLLCAVAAIILGFMGTGRLKRGDKGGAVLLIVGAGLMFISLFNITFGGYVGIVSLALYLVGGIMVLAKRQPIAPPMQ